MASAVAQNVYSATKEGQEENVLDDNNPMVRKFQETLHKHLKKHKEKLDFERQEMVKDLKNAKKTREGLGQKLYNLQQNSDKYSKDLKTLVDKYQKLASGRPALENMLEESKEKLTELHKVNQDSKSEEKGLLHQVDALNKKLHEQEKIKDLHTSDASVLMQATKKATVECSRLEKEKQLQDELVDRLTGEIEKRQGKLASYESQIAEKNEETKAAREILAKARMEIDTINLDKQTLLEQWNKSLGKLQKRNEALVAVQESFVAENDALRVAQLEVKSLEKSIIDEEEKLKKVTAVSQRFDINITLLSQQLAQLVTNQETSQLGLIMLNRVNQELQSSFGALENEKSTKESQLKSIDKEMQTVVTAKHELQIAHNQQLLNSKWITKAGQNILKDIQQIQTQIMHKEEVNARSLSDIAKLQESSNEKQTNILSLKETLKSLQQIVAVKEKEIQDKELSIKKNMALIDKKQLQLNQLKCKADKMISISGSDMGPTELQLNTVRRDLKNVAAEEQILQKIWLKNQRELVELSKAQDRCSKEVQHLQRQVNVYGQTKLHLEDETQRLTKECNKVEKNIENMHRVITQLNKQAYEECTQEDSLTRVTILTEDKLLHSLMDGEKELTVLQDKLEQLRDEEENLSKTLLDSESELLQWQQKFHLTKEVKNAFQAEYKEGEIHALQMNLHKMQVKYSGLCRQQGQVAQGMEKAVHRWDALLSKGEVKIITGKKESEPVALKRQIEDLKRKIRTIIKETSLVENNATILEQQNEDISQEIEAKRLSIDHSNAVLVHLKDEIQVRNREKIWNFEKLVTKQQQLKLYQSINESKCRLISSTPEVMQSKLEKLKSQLLKLNEVLKQLVVEFPELALQIRTRQWQMVAQMEELGVE